MLVLSRKVGQKILLSEGATRVVLQVCRIDSRHVRLGITAPRHVSIEREEIARDTGGEDHA